MSPIKNMRQRIDPRSIPGDPLASAGGGGIGVAASPTGAMASAQSAAVISPGAFRQGREMRLFANLVPEALSLIRKGLAGSRPREETPAERTSRCQQEAVDTVAGTCVGGAVEAEVAKKTGSGEWTEEDAQQAITERYSEVLASPVIMKAAGPFARAALETAQENAAAVRLEAQRTRYRELAKQAFDTAHSTYDPEYRDAYVVQRDAVWNTRDTLGLAGREIDEIEFSSLEEQARRHALDDSWKAQELIDLAQQARPDGSPGLADAAPNGRERLEKLRDEVADTVLQMSAAEEREAARVYEEHTRQMYVAAMAEVGELVAAKDLQGLARWEAANLRGMSESDMEAQYGAYLGDLRLMLSTAKEGGAPGDDALAAKYMQAAEFGEVDWRDVNLDPKLSPRQKSELFVRLAEAEKDKKDGRLSPAVLTKDLVTKLPGVKPRSREAEYFQLEAYSRLKQVDKALEPREYNNKLLETAEEVKRNAAASALTKPKQNTSDSGLPVAAPGENGPVWPRFSDEQVFTVARQIRKGGIGKLRERYGVDLFSLDPENYGRVVGEVQRQKVRQAAIEYDRSFKKILDQFWVDPGPGHEEALMQHERRVLDEGARVMREGFDVNRKLILGEEEDGQ